MWFRMSSTPFLSGIALLAGGKINQSEPLADASGRMVDLINENGIAPALLQH